MGPVSPKMNIFRQYFSEKKLFLTQINTENNTSGINYTNPVATNLGIVGFANPVRRN